MKLSMYLQPFPEDHSWQLASQAGVTHAVSPLPKPTPDIIPWDYNTLVQMKTRFRDAGLILEVIEGGWPPMDKIRLGLPGRDQEIDWFCELIENMGALEIPILCWNFMARIGWYRTSFTTPSRGGALASSYDHALMEKAPLTEVGVVSEETLWENLTTFLKEVVPVAEKANVKLALHPDDPPISPIRGIGRIMRSVDNFKRAIDIVPSSHHGITFCQANFAAMGADIPTTIREFGTGTIHFAHFRDIRGDAYHFDETFHDDGPTDMFEAIKAYRELGFEGPIRPDHAPTMHGEVGNRPGYGVIGRLFAIGYMKGLIEGADKLLNGS